MNKHLNKMFSAFTILALMMMALPMQSAGADSTAQTLPFSQNWTNTGLITASDDWSGVPGIIGYRGDGLTGGTGVDPQTVVADGTGVIDVNANQANPNTFTTGGVAEFDTLTDPVVALQGSGTARAPFLLLHVNTTGQSNITVSYSIRDVDGSADNAIQPVALQYRVGSSGNFTNLPDGFVADATTGPSLATLVTPVSVILPAAANNQPLVQVRIITTDAAGSDEWVGIDDISITAIAGDAAPTVANTTPANGAVDVAVDSNITIDFSEAVDIAEGAITVECPDGTLVATNAAADNVTSIILDPASDLPLGTTCVGNVAASGVTDEDTDDPPDNMSADYVFSFATVGAPGAAVFFNEIHYDNTGTDTGEAIEIAGPTCTDLTGWSVVLYNGANGAVYDTRVLSGPIPDTGDGFGVVVFDYPSNGIQNGAPDGMALVDDGNNIIQFLSYEGTFTAVGGPANGMLSEDIGVSQSGSGAAGQSLRLTGTGSTYNDFVWASEAPNTFGAFNTGQTFTGGGTTNPCGIGAASPDTVFAGDSTLLTVDVIAGTNPASTGLAVTADLTAIGGSSTQAFFDDGTNGDVTAGDNIFSYFATVAASTSPGALTLPATVTDAEARSGSAAISLTVQPPLTAIHDIQGAAHISPMNGQLVSTEGVVTATASNGFFMQDVAANWDNDDATSEGIFVFTGSAPGVTVGDSVLVLGTVTEFRPGGDATGNLTTTEISNPGRSVTVQSSGNPLPAATVIGVGGRVPPTEVIDDDAGGNVETGGTFDATTDGIDFYESMEGMLVQVNDPVVVGPRNNFGEIFVLADDGANAGVRTNRGGIVIQPGDFNPERIQLDDNFMATPSVNVGDHFNESAVGVLDYNFGNFEILITSPLTVDPGGLTREVTDDPTEHQLSVASFNVENLNPGNPPEKFETLAQLIVNNLKAPDVIGLEEIQDNTGPTDNGVVDADVTLDMLIDAIVDAGGPEYEFRQINPVNNEDGGQPGGNIRVGFLFNPERVQFVDRPGGTPTDAVGVLSGADGPELTFSPGRIDPNNAAFDDSRKPLAGEFLFKGDRVFVVVNHFSSKGGDDPLFGRFQPPTLHTEVQRLQQAQVVNDFVDEILALDANANVIVLGDINDFQFSPVMNTLKGGVLVDLIDTLLLPEQYTYVFEGNSQALDHILASNRLASVPFSYDVVHVNAEFADQASDHDPEVALMCVDRTAPTGSATPNLLWPPNHKYVDVTVIGSDNADPNPAIVITSVTSNEPDNAPGPEDGNTTDDIVPVDNDTYQLRAERSDTGTGRIYTITYQVTDACGNSATQSVEVTVPIQLGD